MFIKETLLQPLMMIFYRCFSMHFNSFKKDMERDAFRWRYCYYMEKAEECGFDKNSNLASSSILKLCLWKWSFTDWNVLKIHYIPWSLGHPYKSSFAHAYPSFFHCFGITLTYRANMGGSNNSCCVFLPLGPSSIYS